MIRLLSMVNLITTLLLTSSLHRC